MTAPDFVTEVVEVVSYGETTSFIVNDITGEYNATTNPGGWGLLASAGPNFEPADVLASLLIITPYKGDDIVLVLEMTDNLDPLYWQNVLNPLVGITLNNDNLGLTEIVNGYWQFKSYYLPGYYSVPVTLNSLIDFTVGEIVKGNTSGATGYVVQSGATLRIVWIQGTFQNTEVITGLTSGASAVSGTFSLVGEIITNEVYSYTNNQSILTATRNKVRKQPLDIILPRINEKHALYVSMADFLLETLDDAVEVGQIENYITIFDFLEDLLNRIDETYCID